MMLISKEEFFYRPKTPKEVTTGRKPYAGRFRLGDLVKAIEELGSGQYLEIDFDIIPRPEYGANYALKHGQPLPIHSYDSAKEAIAEQKRPWELIEPALNGLQEMLRKSPGGFVHMTGLSWKGFGLDETATITYITDACEAVRDFCFSENHAPGNEKITATIFPPITTVSRDVMKDVAKEGRKIMCRVPSRSRSYPYPFDISGVPTEKSREMFALALSMKSNHVCEDVANLELRFPGVKMRYKNVRVEDEHVMSAYMKVIDLFQAKLDAEMEPVYRGIRESGRRVRREMCIPMLMNPFILPTQSQMDFDRKMLSQVLIWKRARSSGGCTRHHREPPSEADMEYLHMNRIALRGPRETVFPTKRIRDYDVTPIEKRA